MPQPLWHLSLAQFRDQVASDAPTPSCGAAAAVTASLGLSLVLMAIRIGANPKDKETRELLRHAEQVQARLVAHADADAAAFGEYIAADNEREKYRAARDSVAVPLATAHTCREAMRIAERALPEVKAAMQTDVRAGTLLLRAAMDAVLLNVESNLPLLDDEAERQSLAAQQDVLRTDADQICGSIAG
jgi:formiminotetrahydrofolate cyclodeaminase